MRQGKVASPQILSGMGYRLEHVDRRVTEISVRSLAFLLSLAEFRNPGTTAEMLLRRIGADAEVLLNAGLFSSGPNRAMINVEMSNGDGTALIEDDPESGGFRYFHPEEGYISLEPWRLRTWRLNLPTLAKAIACLLGMPATFRPTMLIDDLLWNLGTPRLGPRKGVPVLFGVRIGEAGIRHELSRELTLRRDEPLALMLTSARSISVDISLPMVSRIVPVLDVLEKHQPTADTLPAMMDARRLAALADPRTAQLDAIDAPAQCAPDGSWLRIFEREYSFRGKKKRLIRFLYDAWHSGSGWVSEEWLLAQAEYDSRRIEDVFKDNRSAKRNGWKEYIEVRDGQLRLRVSESSD